jgi:Acyclic terpene utilisation family protein AtuA
MAGETIMNARKTVRIGAGASDDRMLPARDLAERGAIDYLVFECLAERTVTRENLARIKNPDLGYSPSLHERLRSVDLTRPPSRRARFPE